MSAKCRAERLPVPGRRTKALRHWGDLDPWWVADRVREQVIGAGVTLPVATVSSGPVCAVVEWDCEVLAERLAFGQGPVLHRAELIKHLADQPGRRVPAPLTVLGYVFLGQVRRPHDTLGRLSGMSMAIAAVPEDLGLDDLDAMECDMHGFTAAIVSRSGRVTVPVQGPTRGKSEGWDLAQFYFWLRAEQLFDVASRTSSVPAAEPPFTV